MPVISAWFGLVGEKTSYSIVHDTAVSLKALMVSHRKQVNSLSASMDRSQLLSGSQDGTARVWDVTSRQCLKVVTHKGLSTVLMCYLNLPDCSK